jgi:hypothetical protein
MLLVCRRLLMRALYHIYIKIDRCIYIYIAGRRRRARQRSSVYLLYWYKSTNADAVMDGYGKA